MTTTQDISKGAATKNCRPFCLSDACDKCRKTEKDRRNTEEACRNHERPVSHAADRSGNRERPVGHEFSH